MRLSWRRPPSGQPARAPAAASPEPPWRAAWWPLYIAAPAPGWLPPRRPPCTGLQRDEHSNGRVMVAARCSGDNKPLVGLSLAVPAPPLAHHAPSTALWLSSVVVTRASRSGSSSAVGSTSSRPRYSPHVRLTGVQPSSSRRSDGACAAADAAGCSPPLLPAAFWMCPLSSTVTACSCRLDSAASAASRQASCSEPSVGGRWARQAGVSGGLEKRRAEQRGVLCKEKVSGIPRLPNCQSGSCRAQRRVTQSVLGGVKCWLHAMARGRATTLGDRRCVHACRRHAGGRRDRAGSSCGHAWPWQFNQAQAPAASPPTCIQHIDIHIHRPCRLAGIDAQLPPVHCTLQHTAQLLRQHLCCLRGLAGPCGCGAQRRHLHLARSRGRAAGGRGLTLPKVPGA